MLLYYTRIGPGVTGDSVHYVMGGQSILAGTGYSRFSGGGEIKPITGFPPFYSMILAVIGLTKVDFFEGARILNAILFGASIFLTGLLIHSYTKSIWASLIGGGLILTSLSLVDIYAMVMTEPLYIFLSLLAFFGLSKYLNTYSLSFLFLAGIVAGLSILTRYVGLSLVAAGALSILLLSTTRWRKRLVDCILLAGISLAPLFFWLRRNMAIGGTAVNRDLIYHPMDPILFRAFVAEIASWFVPRILGFSRPLRNVLVGVLSLPWPILFYWHEMRDFIQKKDKSKKDFWALPWILAFYVVFYLIILVLNSTLLDAGTSIGAPSRYLAPVYVAVVQIFVIAVHSLLARFMKWHPARILAVLFAFAFIIVYALQLIPLLQRPWAVEGYISFKYARPGVVQELEAINPEVPIISNNPEMVYVMANRLAYMWPISFDRYRLEEREDFQDQIEATKEKLNRGGVLVVFGWPEETENLVYDILGAEPLDTFIDVTFFGYPWAMNK
jgi:hypothetical protein